MDIRNDYHIFRRKGQSHSDAVASVYARARATKHHCTRIEEMCVEERVLFEVAAVKTAARLAEIAIYNSAIKEALAEANGNGSTAHYLQCADGGWQADGDTMPFLHGKEKSWNDVADRLSNELREKYYGASA